MRSGGQHELKNHSASCIGLVLHAEFDWTRIGNLPWRIHYYYDQSTEKVVLKAEKATVIASPILHKDGWATDCTVPYSCTFTLVVKTEQNASAALHVYCMHMDDPGLKQSLSTTHMCAAWVYTLACTVYTEYCSDRRWPWIHTVNDCILNIHNINTIHNYNVLKGPLKWSATNSYCMYSFSSYAFVVTLMLDTVPLLLVPCTWWQQQQIHLCTVIRTGLKNTSISTFAGIRARSERAAAMKYAKNASVCKLIIPSTSKGTPICENVLNVCTIMRKRPNLTSALFESLCSLMVLCLM